VVHIGPLCYACPCVGTPESRAAADSPQSGFVPAGVVTESNALLTAPLWRREPYRIFFPLGASMALAGIGHWLLHAVGVLADYRSVFHAITQIQAFLTSYAVGFLFTMIPRRTGSTPPTAAETIVCLLMPFVVCWAAWTDRLALSQLAWLVLAVTVIRFAVRRFLSATARRRPPNSFVWIPLAFVMGIAGSTMIALYGIGGGTKVWLHDIGRGLVLQGVFIGLVLGVGGLALPLMTRGQPPPDATADTADMRRRLGHAFCAIVLITSFFVQYEYSLRGGLAMRGLVILGVLIVSAEIWRRPTAPGLNRRILWIAAWALPLGYLAAAAYPVALKAGLHIAFIGGFALLSLAVSTQVTLGHGGRTDLLAGHPWQIATIATLVGGAVVPRALMDLDPARFYVWMAVSSALFLAGLALWTAFLMPHWLPPRAERTQA
jgi:uncharacterized protein involved in response to NO